MMRAVRWEIVHTIFRLDIQQFDKASLERQREHELHELRLNSSGQSSSQSAPVRSSDAKRPAIGRNDLCPCGSGLKYKKCHGR